MNELNFKNERKILIITYYWPPAGGPGVQRWLKFAKYLPENNWKPIIYTPENPSYPIIDRSLEYEIPKDIKIIKRKIWEPYKLAEKLSSKNKKFKSGQFDIGRNQSLLTKLSIFIRGNIFIPDARKFWIKPSISFLKKYLKNNSIDAIVTSGPPHSMHMIGLGLKKEFPKIPWIADFRDPWTQISYYKHLKLTKYADKIHKKMEKSVFHSADIVLGTSYTDTENFNKLGANACCITNGFDEENFNKNTHKSYKFTISYIGVLEQLRNPENIWSTLNDLVIENSDFAENFELKFVGNIDEKILNDLRKTNLKKHINFIGYLTHQDSIKEMKKSNLLLLTNFPKEESKGIIPGKIFEYLASCNTILSIGSKNSDVEKILTETNAGKHFTYDDFENIKSFIMESFNSWKYGTNKYEQRYITQFSRKNLTKKLTNLLNNVYNPKN